MLASKEDLERAFRLLDEGQASFRDLEVKLGIPKSTLQRWYAKRLGEEIEERRKMLADLERKFSNLQMEYDQKSRLLEEDYQKRRTKLETELAKVKKEADVVKASFMAQGLSWDEGVAIVANVASLRAEEVRLRGEVSKLKAEALTWQDVLGKTRKRLQFLEGDEKDLMAKLATHYSQLDHLRTQLSGLEQREKQLQGSVKTLENEKIRLEGEASKLKGEIGKLQKERAEAEASLKAVEAEKEKIKWEIEELGREVEGLTERMIKDAEEKRTKIHNEIGILEREKEKLKAERGFLEHAIKGMLKQLQQAREGQKTSCPPQTQKGSASPLKNLIERLPTPPPLSTRQTRKTRTISTNDEKVSPSASSRF